MPGMSGKDPAERLGIEPVFMSGYTDDVTSRHGTDLGAIRSALDA
jgi:hypothetical protein